jgi:hypothetical protein
MVFLGKRLIAAVIVATAAISPACSSKSTSTGHGSGQSQSKNQADPPTTRQPQTFPAGSECDPNYSGCVPIASDVDCAGGKGDGPAFVKGPVRVIGKDIYHLDGDHDGIGCE